MPYIRHYNQAPKNVKWKYFDPPGESLRISRYRPLALDELAHS